MLLEHRYRRLDRVLSYQFATRCGAANKVAIRVARVSRAGFRRLAETIFRDISDRSPIRA